MSTVVLRLWCLYPLNIIIPIVEGCFHEGVEDIVAEGLIEVGECHEEGSGGVEVELKLRHEGDWGFLPGTVVEVDFHVNLG